MLHRPSLIPDAMKASFKNSHSKQKVATPESNLGTLFCDDEIVIVEPTDPDEDRLQQQQQQQQQQKAEQPKDPSSSSNFVPLTDSREPGYPLPPVLNSLEPNDNSVLTNSTESFEDRTTAGVPRVSPTTYVMSTALQSALSLANALAMGKHLRAASCESVPVSCSQLDRSTNLSNSEGSGHPNAGETMLSFKHPPSKSLDPVTGLQTLRLTLPIGNINLTVPALSSRGCVTKDLVTKWLLSISHPTVDQVTSSSTNLGDADRIASSQLLGSSFVQSVDKPSITTETARITDHNPTRIIGRKKRFTCPVAACPLTFSNRFNLTEHIRTHTGERPFACTVATCTAAFKRGRSLREHMKVHDINGPIPSPVAADGYCPLSQFTGPADSDAVSKGSCFSLGDQNHPSTDAVGKNLVKEHDGRTMIGVNDIAVHQQAIALSTRISSENFTARQNLSLRFSCPFKDCNKLFLKANKMREHARTHTGERPYACPYPGCVATFSRAYGVRRHLHSHTLGLRDPTRLVRLDRDLHKQDELRDSTISEHHYTVSSVLKSGDQSLPLNAKIPQNSEVETDSRIPPVIAPKSQGTLSFRPIAPLPSGPGIVRPHSCPFKDCTKTFAKLYQLRDHIWGHTGRRPFACDYCYSSFVRLYDLRRHEKIHFRSAAARGDPEDCSALS